MGRFIPRPDLRGPAVGVPANIRAHCRFIIANFRCGAVFLDKDGPVVISAIVRLASMVTDITTCLRNRTCHHFRA